jgi:hypothetical protein
MKIAKEKGLSSNSARRIELFLFFAFLVFCIFRQQVCVAVTSKIERHSTAEQFLKGEVEDVIIGSRGTMELGRGAGVLVEKFEADQTEPNSNVQIKEPWSVNCLVVNSGAIYIGTSPNGGIYRYSLGRLEKIYSSEPQVSDTVERTEAGQVEQPRFLGDANKPKDSNEGKGEVVEARRHLANEHIFAMGVDVAGRLLAGLSGQKCRLLRLEKGKFSTIYEPNDARYIFAIAVADDGDIYLGTGPEGKIYKLDSFGRKPELVYDSMDDNILSLVFGGNGFLYAGSDGRGLVYKIEPSTKEVTVLYDSEQDEITSLVTCSDGGGENLYAAATSAKIVEARRQIMITAPSPGRPEVSGSRQERAGSDEGGRRLQIANTKKKPEAGAAPVMPRPPQPVPPGQMSFIYKISGDGFVTDVFQDPAVFFSLAEQKGKLLLGTGNAAKLHLIEPLAEEQAIIYQAKKVSQITAVVADGEDIYIGTANPATLIKLGSNFAEEGKYVSDLIDAGQPGKWGKLQIDADIPKGCKIKMACRSGNVKDVNDPTFSSWSEPVEITGAVELACPLGRFCQYKLVLHSADGQKSPVVREVAAAYIIPNLAPRVEEVSVNRIEAADKKGVFKISYKSKDDNEDKLIYKIDFRKTGRAKWIELEDQIEGQDFEWDGRTVEDGRYEVRVTASDERSNTSRTKLTGNRVSEPVVVDNTGPEVAEYRLEKDKTKVKLWLKVVDELSAVGKLDYTVDSNKDWTGTIPDDSVYDTTEEVFTLIIDKLEAGEHVLTVKVSDDLGNETYKSFEVNMER